MSHSSITGPQWRTLDEMGSRTRYRPTTPAHRRMCQTLASKGLCGEAAGDDDYVCFSITADGKAALLARRMYLSPAAVPILRTLARDGEYWIPTRRYLRPSAAEHEVVSRGLAEWCGPAALTVTSRGKERAATLEKTR